MKIRHKKMARCAYRACGYWSFYGDEVWRSSIFRWARQFRSVR